MPNKLQELTDRLYNEGLSKGKEEGERILSEARSEAASIIAAAKSEAEAIVNTASRQAEDLKAKSESDVRMASAQCLQATKKDIENLLVGGICGKGVDEALKDPEFLKEVIRAVVGKFSASEACDLNLVLPASLRDGLESWISTELQDSVKNGITADFSKKVTGGFSIGPADGNWFISLTDETFKALIAEYMRPVTKKLLFGE